MVELRFNILFDSSSAYSKNKRAQAKLDEIPRAAPMTRSVTASIQCKPNLVTTCVLTQRLIPAFSVGGLTKDY
jgi:hypothetical protein